MRSLIFLLLVSFACFSTAEPTSEKRECLSLLPGRLNARPDNPDEISISKIKISNSGRYAYIATEYLGAGNLQAIVYLRIMGKYCLSGVLGSATDFHADQSLSSGGLWGISVASKSGLDKFIRQFKYSDKDREYKIFSCRVKQIDQKWRKCRPSEED